MWTALVAVPLILFGLFCYGTALLAAVGIVGWTFNLKEFRNEVPTNKLPAGIICYVIFGTISMFLAHYVCVNF